MQSIENQLDKYSGKIVWLASYPKSGNTWFRLFLSTLFHQEANINNIQTADAFSQRYVFDQVTRLDSRLLSDREVKNLIPKVYRSIVNQASRLLFIKAHDAFTMNSQGSAIFPKEVTHKAIHLIRNPLDIVSSLAHHNNISIDKSIEFMNNAKAIFADQANGIHTNSQFPQYLLDWSGHTKSWNTQKDIDVITIKYEDLIKDTFSTFASALIQLGFQINEEAIANAIKLSSFDRLSTMERKYGFREKNLDSPSFFRKGKINSWKTELTTKQVKAILRQHHEMMALFDYLP